MCRPAEKPSPPEGAFPYALVLEVAVGLAVVLFLLAGQAQALGEAVVVPEHAQDVLQGSSVPMTVTFGANDNAETIAVTCDSCGTEWTRTVTYNVNKPNCAATGNARTCTVSFPEGFTGPGGAPTPDQLGEPSRHEQYSVALVDAVGTDGRSSFTPWLSTARVCRGAEALRSDVIRVVTSGHPQGERVTVEIEDADRGRVVFEDDFVSGGRHIAYNFLWSVPIDYDLGPDDVERFEVRTSSPSKNELETFNLKPASPTWFIYADPGQADQPSVFERTESVNYHVALAFLASNANPENPDDPTGCPEVNPFRRVIPVEESQLALGFLRGRVNKFDTTGLARLTESVDEFEAHYVPSLRRFLLNYTIPRDFEVTNEHTISPTYTINVPNQLMRNGNYITQFNSSFWEVIPHTIVPRIERMPTEVERLEDAHIVFNLTYADGSAFLPEDTTDTLKVEFRPVVDPDPSWLLDLVHENGSLWNATLPIPWNFEELGEYVWELVASEDKYGDSPLDHNKLAGMVSDVVSIIGAKPILDLAAFVNEQQVNGAERTNTVHVTLNAVYKDGVPLSSNNVDPGLGGIVLNVKKKNAQGRILDVDTFIMTDADGAGNWVRSFRVGRTGDEAPVGAWELEVIARNDRAPPDENITSWPFEVAPARIAVTPLLHPPPLVRDGEVRYDVRLTYPDGSLFTEELADTERGGILVARLERVNFLNEDIVEDEQRPRGLHGGQEWSMTWDSGLLIPGPHFINVTGRDVYGNLVGPHVSDLFTVAFNGEYRNSTTPICPGTTDVEDAPCDVPRGSEVFSLFPAAAGDKGYNRAEALVQVLRHVDDDRWVVHRFDARVRPDDFFEITGREAGQNHVGYFLTDTTTPTGTYMLFLLGRSVDDRGFVGFSHKFDVTAVPVDRLVLLKFPARAEKGTTLTAMLEHQPGDVVDRAIATSGPVTSEAVRATPTPIGTLVAWTPSRSTPSGPSTIEVFGRDLFGNPFRVVLGPTEIAPLEVRVQVIEEPPLDVARGTIARLMARLTFPDGLQYSSRHGTPEVTVLDESGKAIAQASARFIAGRWIFDWTPTHDVVEQQVRLRIEGRDSSGNIVDTFTSRPFNVVPGTVTGQFLRYMPNPGSGEGSQWRVTRSEVAGTTVRFPSPVTNASAIVTTGTTTLGAALIRVQGTDVTVSFPTERTTELVDAKFVITGTDVGGNTLKAESRLFQIDPQQLKVRFLQVPPPEILKGKPVVVDFIVEYPDDTRLRAGQGVPIVGLFARRDTPLGPIEAKPLPRDPSVWRIRWDPPRDTRTDIPYTFLVSALDRWENTALPAASGAFFISDPLVPDFLPVPGLPLWALLTMVGLAGVAVEMQRRRRE